MVKNRGKSEGDMKSGKRMRPEAIMEERRVQKGKVREERVMEGKR